MLGDMRYLGRYTHRVAISNHRLLAFDGNNVTFRWRDYAHGNVQRTMAITAEEFIRRFLLHVLPKGFVRIRHFGFMANYQRSTSFELCRQLLGMAPVVHSTVQTESASNQSPGPIRVIRGKLAADEVGRSTPVGI